MAEQKLMTQDEFKSFIGEVLEAKIRDLGLDKVDRKHAIFPTEGDANGKNLEDMPREERVKHFLKAVAFGDVATIKALSEGTAADGGYLVPTEFRASVITKRDKVAVIRPRATVIPMGSDAADIPTEGDGVTLTWAGESVELTEDNPTFGNVNLTPYKLTGLSKMSRELFGDSKIDLMDYLAGVFGRAVAKEEDEVFMAGDGSGKPTGIRAATISQSVAQAGASLAASDLIALYYTLPVQYRNQAVWMLHNSVIQLVDSLVDSNGRRLWNDGLGEAPATLLGRPVLEQNDIPTNLGAGTNESEIFFGDLAGYIIGDRQEMTMESTTVGAGTFEKHQVAIKLIERVDGEVGQAEYFSKLTAVK